MDDKSIFANDDESNLDLDLPVFDEVGPHDDDVLSP